MKFKIKPFHLINNHEHIQWTACAFNHAHMLNKLRVVCVCECVWVSAALCEFNDINSTIYQRYNIELSESGIRKKIQIVYDHIDNKNKTIWNISTKDKHSIRRNPFRFWKHMPTSANLFLNIKVSVMIA